MNAPLLTKLGLPAKMLMVGNREVKTDAEGYIENTDEWSEDFTHALAQLEGLELTAEHWEIIRFLRAYYQEHGVQPQVRAMIKHCAQVWGPTRGNNHYLHEIFPKGGPQKQGNRLAGLMKTKGEH